MTTFTKNTVVGLAMLFTVAVSAAKPKGGGLGDVHEVLPEIETTIKAVFKVDAKEVEDVFLEIKRVKRLFTPKKKLNKVKYTIA